MAKTNDPLNLAVVLRLNARFELSALTGICPIFHALSESSPSVIFHRTIFALIHFAEGDRGRRRRRRFANDGGLLIEWPIDFRCCGRSRSALPPHRRRKNQHGQNPNRVIHAEGGRGSARQSRCGSSRHSTR